MTPTAANINIDQCGDDSETDSLELHLFQTQQEPEIQTDPFQFAVRRRIENKKVLTLIPKNATWKIIEEACKKLGIEFAQIRKKQKKAIAEVNKKIKKNGEEAEESDMTEFRCG